MDPDEEFSLINADLLLKYGLLQVLKCLGAGVFEPSTQLRTTIKKFKSGELSRWRKVSFRAGGFLFAVEAMFVIPVIQITFTLLVQRQLKILFLEMMDFGLKQEGFYHYFSVWAFY